MKTILMTLLLISAALSQGIGKYDTTITLTAAKPDSFYIYPINQYLYFDAVTTASCPSYTLADFVEFVQPSQNSNVERIPSQATPLIRVTAHCAGSEATGIKAETILSIHDRYYKIKNGNEDVFFRIAEFSSDNKARIEFSNSRYSTGLAYHPRNDIKSLRNEKPDLKTKGGIFLINGRLIPNAAGF